MRRQDKDGGIILRESQHLATRLWPIALVGVTILLIIKVVYKELRPR